MFTCENTCLLAVYGHPLSRQLTGDYKCEQRNYRTSYKHVVHVVATQEKRTVGLPTAPDMLPGHAYLAYTIGAVTPGQFRRWSWEITNLLVFPVPTRLCLGERPGRGPTRLSDTPGHRQLLENLNTLHAQQTKNAKAGHFQQEMRPGKKTKDTPSNSTPRHLRSSYAPRSKNSTRLYNMFTNIQFRP